MTEKKKKKKNPPIGPPAANHHDASGRSLLFFGTMFQLSALRPIAAAAGTGVGSIFFSPRAPDPPPERIIGRQRRKHGVRHVRDAMSDDQTRRVVGVPGAFLEHGHGLGHDDPGRFGSVLVFADLSQQVLPVLENRGRATCITMMIMYFYIINDNVYKFKLFVLKV